MISKPKLLFGCYAVCVLVFFIVTGMQVSADTTGNVPALIEWTWMPGSFLALWTVGVHSDHFTLACILENIAAYLLVPGLVWKLVASLKKPGAMNPEK